MNTLQLHGYYDYRLVALSVFISILAAYAALDLAGRITSAHGFGRQVWLFGGAIAMGNGIWAMHYIGMEAFQLPIPVKYDWPTVLLSMIAAVLASGVALFAVSRPTMGLRRLIVAGLIMGGGIAAMHYIGMEAMRLQAMCMYSPGLVGLSIALSIGVSMIALHLTFSLREQRPAQMLRKLSSALVMGLAIPIMHYVGMAATSFVLLPQMNGSMQHAIDVSNFDASNFDVAGAAVMAVLLLGMVFLASFIDRGFSLQEQLLAASESQLKTVVDTLTEGILVLDHQGKTILINPSATRLLSMTEGSGYGAVVEQFEAFAVDGEPLPFDQFPGVRALRGEFVQNYEMLCRLKSSGETGVREISTAPLPNKFGESGNIVITMRDITERRRIDEERTRLAAIVESSEDAIISLTDQGTIQSWNRGAERLYGYTADEMIGEPISLVLPEGKADEENETFARVQKGETIEPYETIRKTRSGQSIDVSLIISPIRDGRGNIVGAAKISRDITVRKHLEHQLRQSQKMEAIGQLTGGIAHDFNNLLGIILGNLDLLEFSIEENGEASKQVQAAQTAAERGADLIRRLMALSSNVELSAAATSLNDSVRNLVEWAPALGPHITFTTKLDESMPPVFVDAAGLESALLNLAVNARDAMPKGGIVTIATHLRTLDEDYPPVRTGELKAGCYACVSISDSGHGMSKETLERVFEPFFTTKPRGKGTGLGLAMVYGFVKQSGGTARIYSEIDFGTTVSLYLPLAGEAPEPVPTRKRHHNEARLSGTVLIVDDEEGLLKIAKAFLEEMGYTTYHAQDGASALAVVEQHNDIDLIVTDILMPGGMNGVELTEKIRESLEQVKVIYCSGFPANALAERSMSLVDGPVLHKPYQRAEFTSAVRAVMEGV